MQRPIQRHGQSSGIRVQKQEADQSEPQAPEDEDGTDRDRARENRRDRNPDAVRVDGRASLAARNVPQREPGGAAAGGRVKEVGREEGLVGQSRIVPAPGWGRSITGGRGTAARGGRCTVRAAVQAAALECWTLDHHVPRGRWTVVRDEIWIATGRRRMGVGRALSRVRAQIVPPLPLIPSNNSASGSSAGAVFS
jgi:hypothetical protein